MHLRLSVLPVVVLSFACGCSNPENPGLLDFGPGMNGDGGGASDGPATTDGPMLNLDLGSDVNGPMIVVKSPTAMSEVGGNTVVVTADITATAPSSVLADTVTLLLPTGSGGQATSVPMSLTSVANEYQATADISSIPSGSSNFFITAKDTMGRQGSAMVTYVHDRGPVITFAQPTASVVHGSMNVQIVAQNPLPNHPVTGVTAYIRKKGDITLVVDPVQNGQNGQPYLATAVVNFNDSTVFSPPLDGSQLINASATSQAGSLPAVSSTAQKEFTVENHGPSITMVSPAAGSIVGGVITISAVVTDPAGVLDSSVQAVLGNDTTQYAVQLFRMPMGNTYSGQFDIGVFGRNYVNPSLEILASNQLNLQSSVGEEVFIDNTPPSLELDPPQIRLGQYVNGQLDCSIKFDPVGEQAVNDGSIVQQLITVHARIEDQGNTATGQLIEHHSGIDPTSVFLYAAPVANGPLVVDTSASGAATFGMCNAINPLLMPVQAGQSMLNSTQALQLQMTPIPPGGLGDFTNPTADSTFPACQMFGGGSAVPAPLCLNGGQPTFTVAIHYPDNTPGVSNAAIWSLPPVIGNSFDCLGQQLDSANQLPDGPTCLAVVAKDNAGNFNVSPPIRVCINKETGDATGKCAGWSAASLPSCTAHVDTTTSTPTITAGSSCTPLHYPAPNFFDTRFGTGEVVMAN